MTAEISCGLGRHGWSKRRSSTNSVGNMNAHGKIQGQCNRRGSRSFGLSAGLGEGIRACQLPCGLGLGDAFQLPKEDLASAVRVLRAPEEGTVRRVCGGDAHDHDGYFARVQVELFAVAHCLAGCIK